MITLLNYRLKVTLQVVSSFTRLGHNGALFISLNAKFGKRLMIETMDGLWSDKCWHMINT